MGRATRRRRRTDQTKIEPRWEDAIQQVLGAADGSLHYTEIAELISSQGLKARLGANPVATVSAILSTSLKDNNSPFQRTGRGEYTLKESARDQIHASGDENIAEEDDIETGAVRAFGVYWQRHLVIWKGKKKLMGRQQIGSNGVNFCDQVGVYLLHDRDRVIYVGRASDSLYDRLKSHNVDRLNGRWDRFSWFGLRSVSDDGKLTASSPSWTHEAVIETIETLLIECMEPPLNRRRGDNISGVEYTQVPDPDIEKQQKEQILKELIKTYDRD